MNYSYTEFTGLVGDSHFNVPFAYLRRSDVRLAVNGKETEFNWTTAKSIELLAPLKVPSTIRIYRSTDLAERPVAFSDAAHLTGSDLDADSIFALFALQELFERFHGVFETDLDGNFDLKGARLRNVGTGQVDTEGVNLGQVKSLFQDFDTNANHILAQVKQVAAHVGSLEDNALELVQAAKLSEEGAAVNAELAQDAQAVAHAQAVQAGVQAGASAASAASAERDRKLGQEALQSLRQWWLGVWDHDPEGDYPIGALYYNSSLDQLRSLSHTGWVYLLEGLQFIEDHLLTVQQVLKEVLVVEASVVALEKAADASATSAASSATRATSAAIKAEQSEGSAQVALSAVNAAEARIGLIDEELRVIHQEALAAKMEALAASTQALASAVEAKDSATQAKASATSASASAASAKSSLDAVKTYEATTLVNKNLAEQAAERVRLSEASVSASHSEVIRLEADTQKAADAATNAKNYAVDSVRTVAVQVVAAQTAAVDAADHANVAQVHKQEAADAAIQTNADKGQVSQKAREVDAAHSAVSALKEITVTHAQDAITAKERAEQIASELSGGVREMGPWDASKGVLPPVPPYASFWKISAAGTLADAQYDVGDSLFYSLSQKVFYKVDNTESVSSVNGLKGAVTLNAAHVGAMPRNDAYLKAEADGRYQPKGSYAAQTHTHSVAQVTGLQAALDGKAPVAHTHAVGHVAGLQTALDGKAEKVHGHQWEDLGNVPVTAQRWPTFSEVTSPPATATRWPTWGEVTGKPTTFAPESHAHTIAQVTDLQTQLEYAQGVNVGSSSVDPNTTADHVILTNHANSPGGDKYWHITTTFYSSKSVASNRAQIAVEYNQTGNNCRMYVRSCYGSTWSAWAMVYSHMNKPSAADIGAATVSHSHAWSQITDAPATANRWPAWSEVSGKPSSFTPESHSHNFVTCTYTFGGRELPNAIGSNKLKGYMLGAGWDGTGGALGGVPGSAYSDAIWASTYSGGDVKMSNVLLFSKNGAARIGFRQQDFDSTAWGAFNEIFHTGKPPTAAEVGAAPASHSHAWGQISGVPVYATRWPTAAEAGAAAASHTHTPAQAGLPGLSNGTADSLVVTTSYGTVQIGMLNSGWGHFSTSAPSFHFAKQIAVHGKILCGANYSQEVYYPGNKPSAADIGAAAASHTHTWAEVTGIPATATRWPSWSEVSSKPSTFAPPASTSSAFGGFKHTWDATTKTLNLITT